jgi:predicted Zn-dependent protease
MQLLESHTDEAIVSLEKARNENARLPFVHAYLAAAYAIKGQSERAHAELAEAQKLSNAYLSLAQIQKSSWFDNPKIRALAEATYFPALRKAGLAEE